MKKLNKRNNVQNKHTIEAYCSCTCWCAVCHCWNDILWIGDNSSSNGLNYASSAAY